MAYIRAVGLCLAVFALGAIGVGSASAALPEFTGPFPKASTSTGTKISVETASKIKATCTSATDSGEITGPKTGTVVVRLMGCGVEGIKCTSEGAKEGEIVTSTLNVTLGYINQAKKEVGIDFASPPTGAPFADFLCDGVNVTVSGSVIGKITPINKLVKASKPFKLKFKESKGVQKPTKLEGAPEDVLSGKIGEGKLEGAGLDFSDKVAFTTAVEVKG